MRTICDLPYREPNEWEYSTIMLASHAAECGCEIFGGRECSPVDKYSCRAVKDRAVGKGRQGVSVP